MTLQTFVGIRRVYPPCCRCLAGSISLLWLPWTRLDTVEKDVIRIWPNTDSRIGYLPEGFFAVDRVRVRPRALPLLLLL